MKIGEKFIDGEGSRFHVRRTYDVEPDLKRAARLRSEGSGKSETFWHVGSIPTVVLEEWAREAGINVMSKEMDEVIMRKLNDPDWAKLRVAKGRV